MYGLSRKELLEAFITAIIGVVIITIISILFESCTTSMTLDKCIKQCGPNISIEATPNACICGVQ